MKQNEFNQRLKSMAAHAGPVMGKISRELERLFQTVLAEIKANPIGTPGWRSNVASMVGTELTATAEKLASELRP